MAASAAPARVEVPAECGSKAEFESELYERLGNDHPPPSTWVSIDRDREGYVLRMQVGKELRQLRDANCRELFRAAVVVAVAATLSETPSKPERPMPGATVISEPRASADSPALTPGAGTQFGVGLGGGAQVGVVPRAAFALDLEGNIFWQRLGVLAALRYVSAAAREDENQHGVTVRAWGGQLAGLVRPWPVLETRLGFSMYRLTGSGFGSASNGTDASWAGGPLAGVTVLPLRRKALWVGVGGEVQLHLFAPSFEISDYGEVFTVPPFGAAVFLRVGHQFP